MSSARPSGPCTSAGSMSIREAISFSITFRYRSGWSAGSPTYSSSMNAVTPAKDRPSSVCRRTSSSYTANGLDPVASPITGR